MISYTQRNPAAELLAEGVYSSFLKRGKTVWLDIKMGKVNTAAMEEGVRNSKCVIAVVTGAYTRPQGLAAEGEQPVDNAYFKRTYCVNELRWAVEARVPIQPVILADDKKRVGDLLALAPSDLQGIGDVDFIHLDRRRGLPIWEAGIDALLENITDLQPLSPRPLSEPEPEPQTDARHLPGGAFPRLTNETIREAVAAFCEEDGGKYEADFLHSPAATAKYGPVVSWDVSQVTDMKELFKGCNAFNLPIGKWQVGQVTDMSSMFQGAEAFNQPIGEWQVGRVTNMRCMFNSARAFDGPIGEWQVGQVMNMGYMFNSARAFNQPIGGGRWGGSPI